MNLRSQKAYDGSHEYRASRGVADAEEDTRLRRGVIIAVDNILISCIITFLCLILPVDLFMSIMTL